jgi:Sec-independent protein secretion pathway component TatC
MAGAIIVLYEVSIWIVAAAQKRPKKPDKKQDAAKETA